MGIFEKFLAGINATALSCAGIGDTVFSLDFFSSNCLIYYLLVYATAAPRNDNKSVGTEVVVFDNDLYEGARCASPNVDIPLGNIIFLLLLIENYVQIT